MRELLWKLVKGYKEWSQRLYKENPWKNKRHNPKFSMVVDFVFLAIKVFLLLQKMVKISSLEKLWLFWQDRKLQNYHFLVSRLSQASRLSHDWSSETSLHITWDSSDIFLNWSTVVCWEQNCIFDKGIVGIPIPPLSFYKYLQM